MTKAIRPGDKFHRWTVLEKAPSTPQHAVWKCRCECGAVRQVFASGLRRGKSKSCGCLHREIVRQKQTKHGGHLKREYRIWAYMIQRCTNTNSPSYSRYGGRGICICPEWASSFEAFFADMGPAPAGHQIDRIDNDGDYEPSNCRWATRMEQQNNTSISRRVTWNGRTLSLRGWSEALGIPLTTLRSRSARKWPVEKMLGMAQ